MGTTALLENSLCVLDVSQTSVNGNGPVLTLNLNLTPKTAFIAEPLSEMKRIWIRVLDLANHRLGDMEIGIWSVIDFFECDDDTDCNDGIDCTEDSCGPDGLCLNTPENAFCDDGLFCNGTEICNAVSGCQAGTDPCPGRICDEASNACVDCLIDADCDDGVFCNGTEQCLGSTCQVGSNPCLPPLLCNESIDICAECITDMDCNDGNQCTDDNCNAESGCVYANNTNSCDDGVFCNGSDTCSAGSCTAHTGDPCSPPLYCNEASDICVGCSVDEDCDDDVACTVDTCAPNGMCMNMPDPSLCDDGFFCNGNEICDSIAGCIAGADPCPGQPCDENANQCIGTFPPVPTFVSFVPIAGPAASVT